MMLRGSINAGVSGLGTTKGRYKAEEYQQVGEAGDKFPGRTRHHGRDASRSIRSGALGGGLRGRACGDNQLSVLHAFGSQQLIR